MPEKHWRPPPPRWLLFLREHARERSVTLLARYMMLLVVCVAIFSIGFHVVMATEGQSHRWWVGVYWTVSTMTSLG